MTKTTLPLLPLRDVVIFPTMVVPLFVGREKSIKALEMAMEEGKQIVLVTQKDSTEDNPLLDDIYPVGTLASILQLLKLPDGTLKVLIEGEKRIHIEGVFDQEEIILCEYKEEPDSELNERENEILLRTLTGQFEKYVQFSKKIPAEVLASISSIEEADRLADSICVHMSLKIAEKQDLLSVFSTRQRIVKLLELLESEIDLMKVERRIRGRVKKQMEKSQREYYLNEQMKAIQKELGDLDEETNELDALEQNIKNAGMSTEALEKAQSELKKLRMMSPMSAEASVVRSYLESLISLPWKKRSRISHDLKKAETILDNEHYGLKDVKDRILEYLAVQSRVKKVKGAILCLVGPPGVGKTSLGQSIARATNRKFVRMALGGVRDEAEIRGHRRTYIGSLPGKPLQKMSKVGVQNPLFLLDEIDKMGMDHRGDPASALLEMLDPEQNATFADHYMEVEFDMSNVMFICTANSMDIPGPLLDRMEVIRIPGYTEDEKLNIAKKHLLPKQIKANGLKEGELILNDKRILEVIRYYTKEAGVRGLERELAKVCRRTIKSNMLGDGALNQTLKAKQLEAFLGVRKFKYGCAAKDNRVGHVTGLAWTSVGGELLDLESTVTQGKGRMVKTGSLGDVMQESIQAALTVVKSRVQKLGIDAEYFEKHDFHIHLPEGATPKDGPSAGIGLVTALVSAITDIPVLASVAMTGEITLRGKVLAIGGLKEKLLAAHRGGITQVIIPKENEKDLQEIPENIKKKLKIITVDWIEQVLEVALAQPLMQSDNALTETKRAGKLVMEKSVINTH